ncbi:MAG: hypothetical protein MK186_13920 [Henriciella sp.]|jgi:hypothetical protein|uniref:Uncharacterized protein n=2 Tax=Henriciella marina TaxID=453851 RepID=A0ABT4M276_9PROT|nr:hypothetical protein [Henriciella marina]MCH2459126.1 hypothetical protein [Henriciella sp.]MCZ4299534.1 hypothetical protein [Henriciella marina]
MLEIWCANHAVPFALEPITELSANRSMARLKSPSALMADATAALEDAHAAAANAQSPKIDSEQFTAHAECAVAKSFEAIGLAEQALANHRKSSESR